MSNPFVTNDRLVKSFKMVVKGVGIVAFKSGVLNPDDYGAPAKVRKALKGRTTWPLFGVHFHLRDPEEPLPEDEAAVTVHLGARNTLSLKGVEK